MTYDGKTIAVKTVSSWMQEATNDKIHWEK